MLKTVSSVANAIGALNYKGVWNASTNTPAIASSVGTQGDYYVVSVSGATDLNGITNWGIGDWATFNGSVWQRVEGGADGNFVNLTVDGELDVSGGYGYFTNNIGGTTPTNTHGLAIGWNRSNGGGETNLIFNKNGAPTGGLTLSYNVGGTITDHCVFREDNSLQLYYGNLILANGSGIDFSATAGTGTSELLDDYEEGVWTPTVGGDATYYVQDGYYVKVGTLVYVQGKIQINVLGTGSATTVSGLPFTALNAALSSAGTGSSSYFGTLATSVTTLVPYVDNATATVIFGSLGAAGVTMTGVTTVFQNSARVDFSLSYRSV